MRNYLDLVRTVLNEGVEQGNRTGVHTTTLPGQMLSFDLREGFPAVTTKRLAFTAVKGELCGFLRGYTDAQDFRNLGCTVWDANANENPAWLANPFRQGHDDLGSIYGAQWRKWNAYRVFPVNSKEDLASAEAGYHRYSVPEIGHNASLSYKQIDQLRQCLETIVSNPTDRRIIMHAWNPAELDMMSLPPCHLLYQFHPNPVAKELSMSLYMRSNDLGLGAPFNIAEAALLMHLVGRLTGYTPARLAYFIGDAHVYASHLDMLVKQLERDPLPPPTLHINERVPAFAYTGKLEVEWLDKVEPDDFTLVGYQHHGVLTAPMAV